MKTFATIVALSIATAIAAPAFAQTIKPAATQADCEKQAGMKWDDQTKTCVKK
jgi:hypothetical protein